jgi:hypothetical protein
MYEYMEFRDTNTQHVTASDVVPSSLISLPALKPYDLFEYCTSTTPLNGTSWSDVIEPVILLIESLQLNEALLSDTLRLTRLTRSLVHRINVSSDLMDRADQVVVRAIEIMRQSLQDNNPDQADSMLTQPISSRSTTITSYKEAQDHLPMSF